MNSKNRVKSVNGIQLKGVQVMLTLLLFLGLIACTGIEFSEIGSFAVSAEKSLAGPSQGVTLKAGSGAVIEFNTQNGEASGEVQPQTWSLPHLVLFRNGLLTEVSERTLIVEVSDLVVPPAGLAVTINIETQDGDPDLGGGTNNRISVWEGSQVLRNETGITQTGASLQFTIVFEGTTNLDGAQFITPTGYFRFEITFADLSEQGSEVIRVVSQDYAFLMEQQVILPLEGLNGISDPAQLALYFTDTAPFQVRSRDLSTRMKRSEVPVFVRNELAPAMVEAVNLQTRVWGFSWSEGWKIYRNGEPADRLSVSLGDGETWYHGSSPQRGHSGIAINVNGGNNAEYDSLFDGIMSTFHHELFHNLQRSIALEFGGSSSVDGLDHAWQFFSEGTASFVPTVAQSDVQYSQSRDPRAYIAKSIEFVGGKGFPGELNKSYNEMNPYNAAIYWRFLFEQCGGRGTSLENKADGMAVIHRTLEVLYSKEIVDIDRSMDLVSALPAIMDRVFQSPGSPSLCPFSNFEDSLLAFSQAIYALGLHNGRCQDDDSNPMCGFYDPNELYSSPIVKEYSYTGGQLVIDHKNQVPPAGLPNSYGIDYININLDRAQLSGDLTINLHGVIGGNAEYGVQIWKLNKTNSGALSSSKAVAVSAPVHPVKGSGEGSLQYTISDAGNGTYNYLGVIITRLDSNENADSAGAYSLVISGQ